MNYALHISRQVNKETRIDRWCLVRPLGYLLLGLVFMGVGMYYFSYPEAKWELTPAYSRQLNANCEFLDFYDKHDIWHFCSAIGLYCLLMVSLNGKFKCLSYMNPYKLWMYVRISDPLGNAGYRNFGKLRLSMVELCAD